MKSAGIFVLFLVVLFGVYYIFHQFTRRDQMTDILEVGNTKIIVELADNPLNRAKGLSGRENLCENCGMLFVFKEAKTQYFWMRDMKFPLDFVFIREGRVVEIVENVPVTDLTGNISQIYSRQQADAVLELNAGFVQRNQIKISDFVSF